MDQATTDLSGLLPDGVLADVLGRLALRDVAVSRSVCKAWRAVVDGYGMLRAAELLPLSLAGLLIKYNWSYRITELFARPWRRTKKKKGRPSAAVSGSKRDFLAEGEIGSWSTVRDHCNGLLLTAAGGGGGDVYGVLYVLNPATRRRARVPPCPPPRIEITNTLEYLAYDPAVSPHYQVFSFPYLTPVFGKTDDDDVDQAIEQSEWPPATCIMHVFSSVDNGRRDHLFEKERRLLEPLLT